MFGTLVEQVYQECNTHPNIRPEEQRAIDNKLFDTALELLERRLMINSEKPLEMRMAVAKILTTNTKNTDKLKTHKAILCLSKDKTGKTRLITTNFDNLFEEAAKDEGQCLPSCKAPLLTIPKESKWNSIVYLHGLLPQQKNNDDLLNLVLTSGDFGRAYLTERWAARFVSEVLKQYSLCFLGYSINDPVIRYMIDAVNAEKRKGEKYPTSWAFVSYESENQIKAEEEWKAKGVIPILYKIGSNGDHQSLHDSIAEWSSLYRDGLTGKQSVVSKLAGARPESSLKTDFRVEHMLWALSDSSGKPAEIFANENHPRSFKNWFLHIRKKFFEYETTDTTKPTLETKDWVQIASTSTPTCSLKKHHIELFKWLSNNIHQPELLEWIASQGGVLHPEFERIVIDKLKPKETDSTSLKTEENNNIMTHPLINKLWKLALLGLVNNLKSTHIKIKGLIDAEAIELPHKIYLENEIFPRVLIGSYLSKINIAGNQKLEKYISEAISNTPVSWEIHLGLEDVHITKIRLEKLNSVKNGCAIGIEAYQNALIKWIDLFNYLVSDNNPENKKTTPTNDWNYHNNQEELNLVIELLFESWNSYKNYEPAIAQSIANKWAHLAHPIFKKLALRAAMQNDSIPSSMWVSWITNKENYFMCNTDLESDLLNLLEKRGEEFKTHPGLSHKIQKELNKLYRNKKSNPQDNNFLSSIQHSLALFKRKNIKLNKHSIKTLREIEQTNYGSIESEMNKQPSFSHSSIIPSKLYSSANPGELGDMAPTERSALIAWLRTRDERRKRKPFSNWKDLCRDNLDLCLESLKTLYIESIFPIVEWLEVLDEISRSDESISIWINNREFISSLDDEHLLAIGFRLFWWALCVLENIPAHSQANFDYSFLYESIIDVCKNAINIIDNKQKTHLDVNKNDYPNAALNSMIGIITEVIINVYLSSINRNCDQYYEKSAGLLRMICTSNNETIHLGKAIVGLQLANIYEHAPGFADGFIINMLNWENSQLSAMVWQGFFASNIFHPTLVNHISFKEGLLKTGNHFNDMGEYRDNLCQFMTYLALEKPEAYDDNELAIFFANLPEEGVCKVMQSLRRTLRDSGDKRDMHWRYRTLPFWNKFIPRVEDKITERFAEELAIIIVLTGSEFKSAFSLLGGYLRPLRNNMLVVHELNESGLCGDFPQEALSLLRKIYLEDDSYLLEDFIECLNKIKEHDPGLEKDADYIYLKREYDRRSI